MLIRLLFVALLPALAVRAQDRAPVEVMILGTFHMANPGHDLHNQQVPDVLAARPQGQLEQVVAGLARFKPTRIDVEWPREIVAERYASFLAGTLAPSRNEVVQLGFRLGRASGASVEGIDADGDFPFEAVQAWARTHGRAQDLDAMQAQVDRDMQEQSQALLEHGIAGELRLLNDPARIARGHQFYRSLAAFGGGDEQPGVGLLTAWYKRNFVLCARIAQQVKPGDRVVVIFGAGHAFLLRQCVTEMPGWKLVEPTAYLPR